MPLGAKVSARPRPAPHRVSILRVQEVDGPCPTQVRRIDLGCLPMLDQMHTHGIQVDKGHFKRLEGKLDIRLGDIERDICTLVDDEYPGFNPGSPDQVAELVFDRLKLKLPGRERRLKSGRNTTDDETLTSLIPQHPVVKLVLDHREISKLLTTYVRPMPLMVDEDGRLRTIFKPTRARTGRLASGDRSQKKPNLQNIPTRGDWGAEVRNGFVAPKGRVLVSLDLSQIEMRLAAHLSGDRAMCEVFILGLDIHTQTAIAMFRLVPTDILPLLQADVENRLTPDQAAALKYFKHQYRLPAKTLGFGVLYGVSPIGLQKQVLAAGGPLLSDAECEDYITRWFAAYPLIKRWMALQYQRMRRYGMVWTMFGRVRLIPEAKSSIPAVVSAGDREAGNHGVQGSAADMIKIDMAEIDPICNYFNSYEDEACLPLLQVHDELIFECTRGIAEEFSQWGREVMRTCVPLIVPVDSSADMAEAWGLLK